MSLGTAVVRDTADAYSNIFCVTLECPGDSAYPTGGTAALSTYISTALASLKKGVVDIVAVFGGSLLYTCLYNAASDKLLVLDGTLAQVADTTDLSASTFRLTVLYK